MLVLFQTKPSSVFWVLQVEDMIMAHKTGQHLDSSALDLNQLSADFSVDFIQNLFQNCCLNDSHKMRVSFLKMRCFPLIWDAIFAFIGCFEEVSLATEIILVVGEVAFIYNLNIWTVFFFLFCLTRSGLLGIIFWSWVTEVYIIQSSSWRNPSCNSQWPWNTLSFLQWALLLFSARTTNL